MRDISARSASGMTAGRRRGEDGSEGTSLALGSARRISRRTHPARESPASDAAASRATARDRGRRTNTLTGTLVLSIPGPAMGGRSTEGGITLLPGQNGDEITTAGYPSVDRRRGCRNPWRFLTPGEDVSRLGAFRGGDERHRSGTSEMLTLAPGQGLPPTYELSRKVAAADYATTGERHGGMRSGFWLLTRTRYVGDHGRARR